MANDKTIRDLLSSAQTIAVVGLSNNPLRASHNVAEYLQSKGYRIIPVNPNVTEVLGERAVASLDEISGPIDIVDVFRRSEYVPDIVEAAIRRNARVIWMQLGVANEAAAERARDAGLEVVMDRCILQDHMQYFR